MDRYRILRNIASGWIAISVICLLLCGCGDQAPEPPPKPKEIRKKIAARPGPPKNGTLASADISAEGKPGEGKTGTSESGKAAPGSDKAVSAPVTAADGTAPKAEVAKAQPVQAVPADDKAAGTSPKKPQEAGQQTVQTGTGENKDTKAAVPEKDEAGKTEAVAAKTDPESGSGEAEKTDDVSQTSDKPAEGEEDTLAAAIAGMDAEDADKFTALYNPKGKADPFEPLLREENKKAEKPPEQKEEAVSSKPKPPPRRLTPLERLDLGQLKLVGIIRAENGNKALVEEASGKGYIIVKGTYIGIHSGIVVDILPDRVVVEEQDEDVLGKVTVRKRELKFNRPEGEDYYEM
ncbi:MAG: pilus assembly protein PilP [Desulfococcaceae bacterium]